MRTWLPFFCLVSLVPIALVSAQEMPVPDSGQAEHEWLKQLAGEWEFSAEMSMGPDTDPVAITGTESARMLGNIWLVANGTMGPADSGMDSMLTIGFDPKKKQFVGTWIDGMQNHMWHYKGELDANRKVLTLAAEGPNMQQEGKMSNYRDVFELVDADHKTLTSHMQIEDGSWVKFGTINYVRKK